MAVEDVEEVGADPVILTNQQLNAIIVMNWDIFNMNVLKRRRSLS